jgi:hypothetical protein
MATRQRMLEAFGRELQHLTEREQFEPPKSFREKAPIKDDSGHEEAACTVANKTFGRTVLPVKHLS